MLAIRLDSDPDRKTLYRHEFGAHAGNELAAMRRATRREALMIRAEDVSGLLALREQIVHCVKEKDKPLQNFCLGKELIVLATGEYLNAGQFHRSVRALLRKSIQTGDENLYLVVAPAAIFEAHLRKALPSSPDDQRSPAATQRTGDPQQGQSSVAHLEEMIRLLPDTPIPPEVEQQYVGTSPVVQLVHRYVVRAAASADLVLIVGPTGSGKEVIARLIHFTGTRRQGPFIPVNCGAIPSVLFASELFGRVHAATGAVLVEKEGLWRAAAGGTLFLDEIGDLSREHQAMLMQALEEDAIRPVGSVDAVRVDARVLAATNKDLAGLVRAGRFREDLYYRLRTATIRAPSLRERPEDIPALVSVLWRRVAHDEKAELPAKVVAFLQARPWPGNVRELMNCLSQVHNLFGKTELGLDHFRAVLALDEQPPTDDSGGEALMEPRVFRLHCLRHVRQAIEAVRDAQVRMREVMRGKSRNAATFRAIAEAHEYRVNDLELLCEHPDRFRRVPTFQVVRQFKEGLREFVELLRENTDAALRMWKLVLEPLSEEALRALFEEMNRLLEEM